MGNKLIILILMIFLCAGLVSAVTVTLDSPTTATVLNSDSVTYTINVTGNSTTWNCVLYTNDDGTWDAKETDSSVANATSTAYSIRTVSEATGTTAYNWNAFCNSTNDPTGAWATNSTFGVDTTNPSITVNAPSDKYWDTDGLINISLTVTDNNPNNCTITSTMNTATNTTQTNTAYAPQDYSNATLFNFTGFDGVATLMGEDNTGAYTWSVSCDDDAGNTNTVSIRTIYVDTTAPGAFTFNTSLWATDNVNLWNATTASDYTPTVGWTATTELNFSRYEIYHFKDSYGDYNSSTDIWDNVTNKTQLSTSISSLAADSDYLSLITAYDLAGNSVNMTTKNYKYSTTSIGHSLPAGWVAIMNSGNARSLSSYLNDSGATTVSYFNSTHEFTSHVSGGSNGAVSVPSGEAIFLYMGSAATFSDSVWNTTAVPSKFNLTNQTNSNWNVACNGNSSQGEYTLQAIDNEVNTAINDAPQNNTYANVSSMSYIDWDVPKNIPFKANWSINNGTVQKFGECTWMYYPANAAYQTVDWDVI